MSTICDDLRAAILQALIPDPDKCPEEKQNCLVKLSDLPLTYMRGNGLRKNDIAENGSKACVLYGELFTKHTDGIINEITLSRTNTTSNVLSKSGDILIPGTSTASKEVMLRARELYVDNVQIGGDINVIRPNADLFYPKYMSYVFDTFSSKRQLFEYITGTTGIIHISNSGIKNLVFYLPSIGEQKRIVKEVNELMARVADLEKSADALASLQSHYPDEMRTSLLQAAMQGKLTKQLPEDGDAEDLLEQIKAEKEKLVAEGKIKKQKALAPITDDEIPFSIPENWKWARLADLFQFINGDRGKNYPSKNKLHASGEIPFISAINMQNGTIREDNLLYADRPTYDKLGSGKLNKDDFVICIRGSLGKYCKYPYELGAIASSLIIARKYSSYILDDYIEAYLQSPLLVNEIHNKDNGTAQPNLSAADFIHFLTPVPPLAEQKRIAERLDALMQNINVVGDLTAREQS